MKKFIFEIQSCIEVSTFADNKENAREKIINNLEECAEELITDCFVSEGEEEEKELKK